jgi:O-methyltransferase involved in polyketide biosynthesis
MEPVAVDDLTRPNAARIYDYWLGGRDNYAVDRQAGDRIAERAPFVVASARANRAFLNRAVTALARAGIDQFIDIGAGLPTANNVHQIAQRANPAARVVCIDNDPIVLVHARALLACDDGVLVHPGDARDPAGILTDPPLWTHLDRARPVAVLFVALLHFLADGEAAAAVAAFREALAPGSYLVISHVTSSDVTAAAPDATEARPQQREGRADATVEAARLYDATVTRFHARSREQITALFDGLELLDPGVVDVDSWRRLPSSRRPPLPVLGGVGRVPQAPVRK